MSLYNPNALYTGPDYFWSGQPTLKYFCLKNSVRANLLQQMNTVHWVTIDTDKSPCPDSYLNIASDGVQFNPLAHPSLADLAFEGLSLFEVIHLRIKASMTDQGVMKDGLGTC